MSAGFRVVALEAGRFAPWFALSDEDLAARGARRVVADETPGYPCRVSLEDAAVGDELLLLPFAHHDVASPYRASGPIYVRRGVASAVLAPGELPRMLRHRLLSLRAYDAAGDLAGAEVVEGAALEAAIERAFADEAVRELHVHNARPGCFNCRIVRA